MQHTLEMAEEHMDRIGRLTIRREETAYGPHGGGDHEGVF